MDLTSYIAGHRAERAARMARDAEHRAAIAAKLPEVAAELKAFGAESIILFGSHARGDAQVGSDVDLLVSGIAPERWFAANAAAERVLRVPVDLVPADRARPEVAARARAEGVRLA